MRKGLSGLVIAGCLGAVFACGCEERTKQTPPEPTQAWKDAPLWYDNPALLVPPGVAMGNSTPEQREAARLAAARKAQRDREARQAGDTTSPKSPDAKPASRGENDRQADSKSDDNRDDNRDDSRLETKPLKKSGNAHP